jgi:hypothetical protein
MPTGISGYVLVAIVDPPPLKGLDRRYQLRPASVMQAYRKLTIHCLTRNMEDSSMTHPFPLFEPIWIPSREVLVTPEITSALEAGAAVAIGVSGGKDSAVTALATMDYLEDLGHRGPRLLIHSDLGRVEWRQSLPACQRLADRQ